MRIFAIGASGFVGLPVLRLLVEQGHTVALLHRGSSRARIPPGVEEVLGDRERLPEHRRAIDRFSPDAVLDLIPYTQAHAEVAREVLRGVASRLIVLSSIDVYRNYAGLFGRAEARPDPVPLTELAPQREELYPYRGNPMYDGVLYRDGYEKILVERVLRGDVELPTTILRLPMLYGPGDRQRRFHPYLQRMEDGRDVLLLEEGQARWRATFGYVENVAAAIARAITDARASGRTYNLGEAEAPTFLERILQLGRVTRWKGTVALVPEQALPSHLSLELDWRYPLELDTTRLREELRFEEPFSLEEALRRTVRWERENRASADPRLFDYHAEDVALARAAATRVSSMPLQ